MDFFFPFGSIIRNWTGITFETGVCLAAQSSGPFWNQFSLVWFPLNPLFQHAYILKTYHLLFDLLRHLNTPVFKAERRSQNIASECSACQRCHSCLNIFYSFALKLAVMKSVRASVSAHARACMQWLSFLGFVFMHFSNKHNVKSILAW